MYPSKDPPDYPDLRLFLSEREPFVENCEEKDQLKDKCIIMVRKAIIRTKW